MNQHQLCTSIVIQIGQTWEFVSKPDEIGQTWEFVSKPGEIGLTWEFFK